MARKFRHPVNSHVETVPRFAWLWTSLFGTLYFIVRGVWTHAVISFILAWITWGTSNLIYSFFARGIVVANYRKRGWIEIEAENN